MRFCFFVALATALLLSAEPLEAREITQSLHWNVQGSQLSIARLRLGVGPKVYRAACKYYWSILSSGGTVHFNIVGAGGQLLTSFHVTKEKCGR